MPRRRTLDLAGTIGCIDTRGLKTTLISTVGTHCDVWRTTRMVSREGGALMLDLVIKRPKLAVSHAEIRIMRRDWKILHDRLGDIVPEAIFVETEVQGSPNVVVVAEAAPLWFNVANPAYEEDAVMLMRQNPKSRAQLGLFIEAARDWYADGNGKLIDLFGLDNLVIDVNRRVRYVDSFNVFFYLDLLDMEEDADSHLRNMVEISLERLDYLDWVMRLTRP